MFDEFINIIESLIIALFFMKYLKLSKNIFIALWLILFIELFLSNQIVRFDHILPLVITITIPIIIRIFVKEDFYHLLFLSSFEQLLMCLANLLTSVILSGLNILSINYDFIITGSMLSKLLFTLFLIILLKHRLIISKIYWKTLSIVCMLILGVSVMLLSYIFGYQIHIYFIIIMLILIVGILIYLISQVDRQEHEKEILDFSLKKLKADKQNFEFIQKVNKDTQLMLHDARYRDFLLKEYLQTKQYEKASLLLDDNTVSEFNFISLFECHNDIIDLVINSKMMIAYSNKIDFQTMIADNMTINIEDSHLNSLCSNLLDIALQNINTKNPEIVVLMKQKAVYLIIEVKYTYNNINIDKTTLDVINDIIKLYDGKINIFHDESHMTLAIIIKNSVSS